MWICYNDAFVSAVQHRDDPSRLCVRARKKEHLQRLFPAAEIMEIPSRDYACRVLVSKQEFAELVTRRINEIDYPNFKDSVRDDGLHDLYADFWELHWAYQQHSNQL
ncbi:hypothetical protein [Microvirga calopogonii]|uniref:hypothetical protein n=1 Tax=Microvirga calopogonii TaxID=2078013 RepID=UPI000E0D3E57|nr:hypothetical protein [Microvirga calopogonii]